MIILSSRKFRDNQSEILKKAMTEEVILTTLRYGSFRLVPVKEGQKGYVSPYREFDEKRSTKIEHDLGADLPKEVVIPPIVDTNTSVKRTEPLRPGLQPLPEWAPDPREIEAYKREIQEEERQAEFEKESELLAEQKAAEDESVREILASEVDYSETGVDTVSNLDPGIENVATEAGQPAAEMASEKSQHNTDIDRPKPEASSDNVAAEAAPEKNTEHHARQVWVDPSLLTMEELMRQEGIEPEPKKKGFLGGIFGHKSR